MWTPGSPWTRRGLRHPGLRLPAGGGDLRDYFNVVGLPVCRLGKILARFGVEPLRLAAEKERRA